MVTFTKHYFCGCIELTCIGRALTYEEVVELQKLLASDGAAGDLLGTAVAMDRHILVIGAYLHGGKGASIALFLLVHNHWSFSTV